MKFRIYEIMMFVLLVSVCLALASPVYRYIHSIYGGKQRVVSRLNHAEIRTAGQELIAKKSNGEEVDFENDLPEVIANTRPTSVFSRDDKLYLEYGNATATYGLIVVMPENELPTLTKIIDGVYYYESNF